MKNPAIFFLFIGFVLCIACGDMQKNNPPITTNKTDILHSSYTEQHRPQFHFSPPANWMNDPNGMVYFEGEYHLFYQHYPDSTVWGPMHWGHAVSTDLVTWEHLPIALYPDSLGYIFSGSAVVDWKNTSGFGVNGEPPLIAIFTHHNVEGERAGRNDFQYQSIAYSNDRGRTWTKYEGNPVVPNPGIKDFRDPKVIWDEDRGQWVMVFAAWDHVKFYTSPNLKNWNYLSDFGKEWGGHGGVWECPDLFPMTVESTGEKKWVLLLSINPGGPNGGSATQYFVGDFDGKNFILDENFARTLGSESGKRTRAYAPPGRVFTSFEGTSYGDWNVSGSAFGNGPTEGELVKQIGVEGFTGKYLVHSQFNGDQSVGSLTSPPFIIERPYINFQIGGGNDKLKTAITLLVNGKVVRTAAGSNSERMNWMGWDVSEYKGQRASIQIIDQHTGGWGHINVDQIMFSDRLARPATDKAVWLDWGRDNYAGVTFSDTPDGRRIFMGWMSNWDYAQVVPTVNWRSAMTLPRELILEKRNDGFRLRQMPVNELENLRSEKYVLEPTALNGKLDLTEKLPFSPATMEVVLMGENLRSKPFGLELSNSKGERYSVGFDPEKNQFFSDRTHSGKTGFSNVFAEKIHAAPRSFKDDKIEMHIFIDVASCEFFADGGASVMTDIFFPNENFTTVKIIGEGEVSGSIFSMSNE